MFTARSMRRVGIGLEFRMIWLDTAAFGTTMATLSSELSVVVKMLIASTTAVTPAASMRSPFRNGRKTRSMTPAAKLAKVPCRAKPTARPAAARTAMMDAVWMPIIPKAATTTNATIR